ncbi:hypothetical protein V6N13_091878 [Hibiscus sabdariffa]
MYTSTCVYKLIDFEQHTKQILLITWNKSMECKKFSLLVVAMAVVLLLAAVAAPVAVAQSCYDLGHSCEGDWECCYGLCATIGGRDVCA